MFFISNIPSFLCIYPSLLYLPIYCVGVSACATIHLGRLSDNWAVFFFFNHVDLRGLNSGHQARQQVPLPTEAFYMPYAYLSYHAAY